MPRSMGPLPEALARSVVRFDEWRATRITKRERIPGRLWEEAAGLAAKFGVSRTALALGVGYYDLKSRVETAVPAGVSGPAFVELFPPAAKPECVVEFEDVRGTKMRIRLTGGAADVVALSRLFLERRA